MTNAPMNQGFPTPADRTSNEPTPIKKPITSRRVAKVFRVLRVALASVVIVLITWLFIDPTTTWAKSFGWVARMQFVPAVLSLNAIFLGALFAITLILGRIYCAVLCPLGIFQDLVSRAASMGNKGKRRLRFTFTAPWTRTKWAIFVLFCALILVGFTSIAAMIEPYAIWGRIGGNLINPFARWVNNHLSDIAAAHESYAFSPSDIHLKSLAAIRFALMELILVGVFAWRKGRLWCNALCPVGTTLGLFSRFALIRPRLDAQTCVKCRLCERGCRSSCIDVTNAAVDASRCVDCMDCASNCPVGAIRFTVGSMRPDKANLTSTPADAALSSKATDVPSPSKNAPGEPADDSCCDVDRSESAPQIAPAEPPVSSGPLDSDRRALVVTLGTVAGALAFGGNAHAKESDGGLAPLAPREAPHRETPVLPPGSKSLRNMSQRCIGCHLCVASCPNNVIAPSKNPKRWMQPELAFHRSRCRPECHRCSRICPTGAIQKVSPADKVSLKIGTALWNADICLASQGKYECGNCARHCPAGAIHMGKLTKADDKSFPVPMVDAERCIGCGACEQLCPVRPVSAIVVHGVEVQRMI